MIRYYSLGEFELDIKELADKIDTNRYSSIYGVPRGGIPVAMALSNELDIPLQESPDLDDKTDFNCLVVDDLIDNGQTRNRFKNDYAVIHVKKGCTVMPTYYVKDKDPNVWIEYWWEKNEAPAEDAVIRLIQMIGEDPKREGLKETPKRVIKSYQYLFSGYNKDPKDIIKTFSSDGYDQIVLLKNIELYSMCEHHLLPFWGQAHVGYIPNGKIVGISKLARLVDLFSRRMQIQERLCDQVTSTLMELLEPVGAACIIEATHLCMRMRGVEKQNSEMVTSSLKGIFLEETQKGIAAREELMRLIG